MAAEQTSSTAPRDPTLVDALASGAAAALHRTLIAPVERLRHLVQAHGELGRHGRAIRLSDIDALRAEQDLPGALRRALVPRSLEFAFDGSTLLYWRHIRNTEGWLGFFRGNGASAAAALGSGPASLYLVSPLHRWVISSLFLTPDPAHSPFSFFAAHTAAAVISGAFASILLYPLDAIKLAFSTDVKLPPVGAYTTGAAHRFEYESYRDLGRCVLRGDFANSSGLRAQEAGLLGAAPYACLYRGLGLGIAGQVLYRITFTGTYNTVGYLRGEKKFTPAQEFAAGYFLTGLTTLLLYPLDTIRIRYIRAGLSRRAATIERTMSAGGGGMSTAENAKLHVNPNAGAELAHKSWIDCAVRIFREEGPHAFFRGASLLPVKSFCATCAAFAVPRLMGQHMLQ